jgi:hypothetical protein
MKMRRAQPLERLADANACWMGCSERLAFDCPIHEDCRVEVPTAAVETDGKWGRTGTTIDTLTITPSIRRQGACGWHGFIRGGRFETCGDSE